MHRSLLPSPCPPEAPALAEPGQGGSGLPRGLCTTQLPTPAHTSLALWHIYDSAGPTQATRINPRAEQDYRRPQFKATSLFISQLKTSSSLGLRCECTFAPYRMRFPVHEWQAQVESTVFLLANMGKNPVSSLLTMSAEAAITFCGIPAIVHFNDRGDAFS